MSTTEAQNRDLVSRLYEEVIDQRNFAMFDEVVAEDFANHNPMRPSVIIGADEWREGLQKVHSAFPDFFITVHDTIVEDNKVVLRITEGGTHEGEIFGIEPTGKTVEVSGIHIYRVEEGKLAERWVQSDVFGLFQQLGVIDPPGKYQDETRMTPTEVENKELERQFIEKAFNNGDVAVVDEIFADDYLGHTSTSPDDLQGPEAMKEYIEMSRAAFPDLELRLEHLVAEGDRVAAHWTASGTHEGELMGIDPTGNSYEAQGMEITRIEDGKIIEQWHVGDQLGMLQQLGVMDEP